MEFLLLLAACGAVFAYARRDRITFASARRRTLHRFVDSRRHSPAMSRWTPLRTNLRWSLPRRSETKTTEVPLAVVCADFLDNVERNVRLSRSLRSGILEAHALLPVGALREALEHTVLYCRTGAPLEELLTRDYTTSTVDSPDVTFVVQSLVAAAAGGTGTAHALERASWVLRERQVVREERRVNAAQAVLSARVMSWMPVGFGSIMLLSSPSIREVVLFSPLGLVCIVIGVALNLVGRRWMGRITGAIG